MEMETPDILRYLEITAQFMQWEGAPVELLLIGGAAGMLMGQLPAHRVTQDCDIMHLSPQAVLDAAAHTARENGLPQTWLNTQAMDLNILPDGWQSRRKLVARYEPLSIYAVGRLDLLAMKFYANRPQDREDITETRPSRDEIDYCRRYLHMLRVPSRQADLDQVVSAFHLVDAIAEYFYGR